MSTMLQEPERQNSAAALRWSAIALVAVVWLSAGIFGIYIIAFYGGAIPAATLQDWNATLPGLYDARTPEASVGIGAHFFAGAVLLLLGPVQLVKQIRNKALQAHKWIGRVYAFAAFAAGVGGLVFIALKGTVGGWVMTLAFAMYGVAMITASFQTVRHAMARRVDTHRAWAIRLFALAIGSWLYRMGYGFWFLFAGETGHTEDFRGWFDYVMDFAFFVPPLLVAEMFVRARKKRASTGQRVVASAALAGSAAFIGLATYFFTTYSWGPAVMLRLGM